MECDLLIVGGGPAGYEAALAAARRGLKTVLAEKEHLGGTCLNWGCIPTKLLLGATAAVDELEAQARLRLATGQIAVDLAAVQKRKGQMLAATRKAMAQGLTSLNVRVLAGQASFTDLQGAVVGTADGEEEIEFGHCILATGSRATFFPGLQPDGLAVLDSDMALGLEQAPQSLIIVGGGYIGVEMAENLRHRGLAVDLVEMMEQIMPPFDAEYAVRASIGSCARRSSGSSGRRSRRPPCWRGSCTRSGAA